jgi:DHA1 family bicyclomycin/chloramphenicol resistance-like MFS transporter
MLGLFSIDTYLLAFTGIVQSIGATPVQMQQTLSAYLFAFCEFVPSARCPTVWAGRRPVVLGRGAFTLVPAGCGLCRKASASWFLRAVQVLPAGAGIRPRGDPRITSQLPADAQRVMSQVTIYFGVALAIAPIVWAAFLFIHADWHSGFTAGVVLWWFNFKLLPETLHDVPQPVQLSQPHVGHYRAWGRARSFDAGRPAEFLSTACFVRAVGACVLGEHLHLGRAVPFWFFLCRTISGQYAGRVAVRAKCGPHETQAPNSQRLRGDDRHFIAEPGAQPVVHTIGPWGHVSDCDLCVWLGAHGAVVAASGVGRGA